MQEQLTVQIADRIQQVLSPDGVAVYMVCDHMCQRIRGVKDPTSAMVTQFYNGTFEEMDRRKEFIQCIAL